MGGHSVDITENRLQQNAFCWLWNTYPALRGLYFEIHNNAFSAQSGMRHKAIGRIAGVADNCLLLPGGSGTIFFEFKSTTGKQSPAQEQWQGLVARSGYQYHIIRGLQEFQNIVRSVISPTS